MTCGVCLEDDVEVINIFNEEGVRLEISSIISQHFWFEPIEGDSVLSQICSSCWKQIANFHLFYSTVKEAHKKFSQSFYTDHHDNKGYDKLFYDPNEPETIDVSDDELNDEDDDVLECETEELSHCNDESPENYNENILNGEQDVLKDEHESVLEQNDYCESVDRVADNQYCAGDEYEYQQISNGGMNQRNCYQNPTFYSMDGSQYDQFYNTEGEWQEQMSESNENAIETGEGTTRSNSQEEYIEHSDGTYSIKPKNKFSNSENRIKAEDDLILKHIKLDCEQCGTTFIKFQELTRHYQIVHNISGYVRCCDRKLPSRAYILDHINKHINPDNYKCSVCNKTFATQYALKNHLIMKHASPKPPKLFQCEDCPKRFTNQNALNQHTTHHMNQTDKRLYCIDCRKTFPSTTAIQMHKNVYHRKLVGHICHVCGKVLSGKALFIKHVQDHAAQLGPDAINNPVCPICGKISASIKTLRHHIRYVHSSERPYKCDECGKSFKIRQKLNEHMGTHAVGVSLPCPYCPKRFRSKIHVYSHKYRMHKREYEKEKTTPRQPSTASFPKFDISYGNTSNVYGIQQTFNNHIISGNSSSDDCYVVT